MAREKVTMAQFQAKEKTKAEQRADAASKQPVDEMDIASPLLSPGAQSTNRRKKTERMSMTLPVSGATVTMVLLDIDPSECLIHPSNQREQSFLRIENPKIAQLMSKIESETQREPVFARWKETPDGKKLEVLDGSRRRFVCEKIHEKDPSRLLRAWVGNIDDGDAQHIAKFGNEDRDAISPWEKAIALNKIRAENPDLSLEAIASAERISSTQVRRYLMIADIPFEVVDMLASPDLMSIRAGEKIIKLLGGAKWSDYIPALRELAPYQAFSDLHNQLKNALQPPKVQLPSKNRKVSVVNKEGNVRATVNAHRVKPNHYKIELADVSQGEYEAIMNSLNSILK